MAEPELCRTCSQALPDDAPWGLCPACLLGQAIEGEIEGPFPTEESRSRLADRDNFSTIPSGKIDDEARPADFPEFVGRYRLVREIGRGGMGQVILGLDVEIGREIALKVLIEKYRDSAKMALRFVEEAQIGGRLVHPAIVPVYEMGTFPDGRPFFVMKLVEGRTLADLLNSRSNPTEDLPRYLSIFDQVCQAMAYAHFRRVIHRDLKSPNVMVGAFGEVQTMDWGMAKLISREGQPEVGGVIRTFHDGSLATVDGSVKGTPNYMSPEQARGEGDRLDERTDVFSLGAILCEILTGRPPYLGESSDEILAKAAKADLADALAELGNCGADVDLQALARHCLAADQDDRPSNAGEVATAMAAYFKGVQNRLRQAELDRVEAETRAEEESKRRVLSDKLADEAEGRATSERKQRRLQVGLAAAVLALTTMGGLGAALFQQQKSAKAAVVTRAIGEASTYGDLARSHPEDVAPWRTALAAVKQAKGVAGGDPEALRQIARLRDEVQAGLDAAESDKTLLDRLVDIRSGNSDDPEDNETDAAYAEAFREAGLDLSDLPPAEAGARIKARSPSVVLAVTAALDWAIVRRGDTSGIGRLAEAARVADPDPWRNDLRASLAITDKDRRLGALKSLAATARFNELGPVSLDLLGATLADSGDLATAETLLRRAQQRYPNDFWVNYDLAMVLDQVGRRDDAICFSTAARALRPETAHTLAHRLIARGEADAGIEVFQELARLRPKNGWHLGCLGKALQDRGRTDEAAAVLERAVTALREMIRLKPDEALTHRYLATALLLHGKLDEAEAEFRRVIRLKPESPSPHGNLGVILSSKGKLDDAIAEYRQAIRLDTEYALGHYNLGNTLSRQGKVDEAIAEYREAIRCKPDDALAHSNLGMLLSRQGKLDDAIAEYRLAIRFKPDSVAARNNLGNALTTLGKLDDAIAELRQAIRLKPNMAEAHNNLGDALSALGKLDEALAEYRVAVRYMPNNTLAQCNIGAVLRAQGDYAGSLVEYRKGHEMAMKTPGLRYPTAQWVSDAERLTALAERLPALLKREDHPKDAAERVELAKICYDTKRFAAAARFFTEALEADPKLGDDRQAQYRYNAACAASLASIGHVKEEPTPDDASKAQFRGQALGWLKAELQAWTMALGSGPPQARSAIVQTLRHWQQDTDLVTIRDPKALAMFPEAERKEWQSLWADVEALLKRAQE
ncbi:MAG: serine/threonine protein kinase [Planctomycetota bacterium]|nr:serine/threonine protein kinase [Planctomycetota bacterium]